MTELEAMRRAKLYIDKLANGINPLNGAPVPEGDVLNDVRLCRCFFYVSDVLRRVIENGGTVGRAVRTSKAAFAVTREQLDAFPFSDKPIPVSEIARRISGLVPATTDGVMKRFQYKSITEFLMNAGFLTEVETASGRRARRPTETGAALGIFTEERVSPEGHPYTVVLYDRDAQRFLMDNIDAILSIDGGAERPS